MSAAIRVKLDERDKNSNTLAAKLARLGDLVDNQAVII